jgi:hypothetical protein
MTRRAVHSVARESDLRTWLQRHPSLISVRAARRSLVEAAGWAARLVVMAIFVSASANAQPVLSVITDFGNTLSTSTPSFFLQASSLVGVQKPLRFTLQIATRRDFTGPILVDTTILADSSISITLARPLPQNVSIFWRASAVPTTGVQFASAVGGPAVTPFWLELVFPAGVGGNIVGTRRPTFVWHGSQISPPAGPWEYELEILNLGRAIVTQVRIRDTTFVPPLDLDANTSYRWSVRALAASGDSVRVHSPGTFVILDQSLPTATLFYQNFPNPFPTPYARSTCFWFDLGLETSVSIEVFDLRGNRVRRVFPTANDDPVLKASRYGRAAVESDSGCDPRFSWDGTSDERRRLPAGVYLVRFRAGAFQAVKKIVLKDG